MVYDITFKRLPSESNMDDVLQRPWTEEIEDYKLYKKLKTEEKEKRLEAAEEKANVQTVTSDGAVDERVDEGIGGRVEGLEWGVYEDETAEEGRGSVVFTPGVVGGREVLREIRS